MEGEQLLIYQWAAQEFLQEKVSNLKYLYLESGQESKDFLGSVEDIDGVKEGLLETIAEIRQVSQDDSFAALDKKRPEHQCEFRNY